MTGFRQWLLGLGLALVCQALSAESQPTLKIGLHYSAPWAYATEEGKLTGIEYRIVQQALTDAGYRVDIEVYTHKRLVKKFRDKDLDFASPMAFDIEGATYTERYLPFHDVAATHPDYHVHVNELKDLFGKKIVAYQGATDVLGQAFTAVTDSAYYMEMADRKRQIDLLFNNRVEVVVGERYVLEYYANKYHGKDKLVINDIFPQVSYPGAAWDPAVAEAFNRSMDKLRQSGELQRIFRQPLP
ncbi:hypothetical protein HMF8227_01805 [Saliniradius amylolyticus]|uniref:Solute-binding protein family 3/N-terminal domain-containing protein n=1 Tax=Saliniradius amylolyticus TaxID=2183582 RepID=A0A2S2E3Q2_9ALTE|nr:transporter substrate-binding domain-containing protein [Saliniradius amylolyticus]AWL12278.1 hypothetical protein HMF8227_01805 [Saliniradius amylolyticus]